MRIVQSFKQNGVTRHKTLYSLGKVEDYPPEQLQRIATKLLELAGCRLEDIVKEDLREVHRFNYGYALVIKALWKRLNLDEWMKKINYKRRIRFDWLSALELMITERINEPCSKRSVSFHQGEYIGFGKKNIDLHHLYRCLDLLSQEQESLKKHLFITQQNLFSTTLDVVFYDVTTLYFDSQKEQENSLRQKGYSKDGKVHKTQVVLGLLVDKLRNPITYHLYQGNAYEGKTMIDALEDLQKKYAIDQVIVVADSAMIDASNRAFMEKHGIRYIIGDRIKNLPRTIAQQLIDKENHRSIKTHQEKDVVFSYSSVTYENRKIICTYSSKRAAKDRAEREKLIEKAQKFLANPSAIHQLRKRGAGRFIKENSPKNYALDVERIHDDEKWDGYKAISTNSNLSEEEVIGRYAHLFEVEHAFRCLKTELEIRPMFHWTNQRIEGHIAMCFMAYTMLNHLRLLTGLQNKTIVRALDSMQLSEISEGKEKEHFYLRSAINAEQEKIINALKLEVPKDCTPQRLINQYFT